MTSERLGQTVRKPPSGETNISSRFIADVPPPFAALVTLRWVEPTGPDDSDDIGFSPADYAPGGGSGIFIFPPGSDGEYLQTVFIEATAADGTLMVQLDDMAAGIFERVAVPVSEGFARLSLATFHRFYYYDPNPLGGNVGFSVGLYPFNVTGFVELVTASLTVTKLRAI